MKYAGFFNRLAAKVIDQTILISILIIPLLVLVIISLEAIPLLVLAWILLLLSYDIYFIKNHGATPGKMVVGLKVVKEDKSKITWGDSIIRFLFFGLGTNTFVLYLGSLWIIWDKKKQGWHDKAARTLVIQK